MEINGSFYPPNENNKNPAVLFLEKFFFLNGKTNFIKNSAVFDP